MTYSPRLGSRPFATKIALGAAGLGALAVANVLIARSATRRNPPKGCFVEVDGVRLHYTDRGAGSAVVLVHGNMVTGEDFDASGVAELLEQKHRVVIFDRPGFGHSERPRGRVWTAGQQADLLARALRKLGVVRPVVVGHSWGALVAMTMAVRHEARIAGVVALSGYYFWTIRPDVALVGIGALPGVGDILGYTISPWLNRMLMPLIKRALFLPGAMTKRFASEFSTEMAVRPSQLRATSQDGALMIPGALALHGHYENLKLPVVIVAGAGDIVVFERNAERLRDAVEGSVLHVVQGAGHMVHHQSPERVVAAVDAIASQIAPTSGSDDAESTARPARETVHS